MDLREFIRLTLLDVMEGVKAAQSEWQAANTGEGVINPAWDKAGEKHVRELSFDVAVNAEETNSGKMHGGIKVFGTGGGGDSSSTTKNSVVSRIQFAVPYLPPVIAVEEKSQPLNWTPPKVV